MSDRNGGEDKSNPNRTDLSPTPNIRLSIHPPLEPRENDLAILLPRLVLLPQLFVDLEFCKVSTRTRRKPTSRRRHFAILLESVLVNAVLLEHRALDGIQVHLRRRSTKVDDSESLMVALVRRRDADLDR